MSNVIKLRGFGPKSTAATAKRVLLNKDGTKVSIGQEVTSFRGEKYTVTGWPHNGHNRVWVVHEDADGERGSDEFFPSVFDLVWAE